jgi:hypothetical protein
MSLAIDCDSSDSGDDAVTDDHSIGRAAPAVNDDHEDDDNDEPDDVDSSEVMCATELDADLAFFTVSAKSDAPKKLSLFKKGTVLSWKVRRFIRILRDVRKGRTWHTERSYSRRVMRRCGDKLVQFVAGRNTHSNVCLSHAPAIHIDFHTKNSKGKNSCRDVDFSTMIERNPVSIFTHRGMLMCENKCESVVAKWKLPAMRTEQQSDHNNHYAITIFEKLNVRLGDRHNETDRRRQRKTRQCVGTMVHSRALRWPSIELAYTNERLNRLLLLSMSFVFIVLLFNSSFVLAKLDTGTTHTPADALSGEFARIGAMRWWIQMR